MTQWPDESILCQLPLVTPHSSASPIQLRARVQRVFLLELPQRLLVLIIEVLRDDHADHAELIALLAAALDAAGFDAQFRVAAGAGGDRDRDRAFERRHFDFRAEQ